jgi:DNA primase small subunit
MALRPLVEAFGDIILMDQDCFASEEGWEALLQLIPDKSAAETLRRKWTANSGRSSEEKWDDVKEEARKADKEKRVGFIRVNFTMTRVYILIRPCSSRLWKI